jgi:hypothetical protein
MHNIGEIFTTPKALDRLVTILFNHRGVIENAILIA